jgi:hypothetical protein
MVDDSSHLGAAKTVQSHDTRMRYGLENGQFAEVFVQSDEDSVLRMRCFKNRKIVGIFFPVT